MPLQNHTDVAARQQDVAHLFHLTRLTALKLALWAHDDAAVSVGSMSDHISDLAMLTGLKELGLCDCAFILDNRALCVIQQLTRLTHLTCGALDLLPMPAAAGGAPLLPSLKELIVSSIVPTQVLQALWLLPQGGKLQDEDYFDDLDDTRLTVIINTYTTDAEDGIAQAAALLDIALLLAQPTRVMPIDLCLGYDHPDHLASQPPSQLTLRQVQVALRPLAGHIHELSLTQLCLTDADELVWLDLLHGVKVFTLVWLTPFEPLPMFVAVAAAPSLQQISCYHIGRDVSFNVASAGFWLMLTATRCAPLRVMCRPALPANLIERCMAIQQRALGTCHLTFAAVRE